MVAVTVVALLVALVALDIDPRGWIGRSAAQRSNPFLDRELYLDVEGQGVRAARAAAASDSSEAALLKRVAAMPTAVWLTPEAVGLHQVEERVAQVASRAEERDEVAVFVIYGIADRDCSGGYSRGGLEPEQYRTWVERAARAMSDHGTVVAILEPDALAMMQDCADPQTRLDLLVHARKVLDAAHVTTYVDAGHSAWIPATEMAERLRSVGVDEARGFSVNVAAYRDEAETIAYAEDVVRALGDDSSYVMDTGRNGAGASDQWCNPVGRALGQRPGPGEGRLDARLWVKPPGESDGTCGGGPPAGRWWNARAVDLARSAGW